MDTGKPQPLVAAAIMVTRPPNLKASSPTEPEKAAESRCRRAVFAALTESQA